MASADGMPDYEEHFHAAASGYLVLAPDGLILDVNRTLLSWTGHAREALLGRHIGDLLPVGDRVLFAAYVVPQLAVSGCFNEMAVELVSEAGERIEVLLSGVRSEGGASGAAGLDRISVFKAPERRHYERKLVAALRKAEAAEEARAAVEEELRQQQKALEEKDRVLQENLAASREREALLETVLNAVDVGLLVVDGQGDVMLKNAHLSAGRDRARGGAEPGGWRQLMFGPDRITPLPEAEDPLRRAAAGDSFSNEIMWFGAGADQLALNVSARPIRANGTVTGAVIAFSDVTRLVRAVAAQEEFVASVSHELRTPLTSILGYLDLALADESLSPEVTASLEIALRNSERLLGLVSDLLSVASGITKMQRRPVDVAEIVQAGIRSAAPKARANRVELRPDLPASLVAEVDAKRLAQVVDNLVSNAVKYTPGGGTVEVALWAEQETVHLRVSDTGIGMSPAEQEKVFTKFFRARGAVASAVPGVGLGLVITKNIVEAHGGSLSFVSAPGEGTVFSASLPRSGDRVEEE